MINFIRGLIRNHKKLGKETAVMRYNGMTVIGYVCLETGYEWYESRF